MKLSFIIFSLIGDILRSHLVWFAKERFSDIALEEKGVALVPGTSFGDSAKKFVRISYANSMENLEKAIYRLSTI